MATVQEIITRTLRRLGVIDALHTPSAEDAAASLDVLNEMLASWPANGVNILPQTLALADTFVFFVPPERLAYNTMDVLTYGGDWDASSNSPSLADGTGTEGTVYKVSVAGSTDLDDTASWSLDDYLVLGRTFSATASTTLTWQKGLSSSRHTGGVISMLAERLAPEYGTAVHAKIAEDADTAWRKLLSDFIKTPIGVFDPAITRLPSRRWPYSVPSSESI